MLRLLLSNQTNEDNVTLSRKRHDDLQQSCVVVTTFMGLHQLHMVQHKRDSDSQQKMYCSRPSQSRMNHTWCSTRDSNSQQTNVLFSSQQVTDGTVSSCHKSDQNTSSTTFQVSIPLYACFRSAQEWSTLR